MKKILLFLFCIPLLGITQNSHTINTVGNTFSPDTIICDVGDTINFILGLTHNAVEVDQATFIANDTTSSGGFNIGFGTTGSFIPTAVQSYYYVCQPHVTSGMKGVIIANAIPIFGCTDSTATNYDPLANSDDGTCTYPLPPAENLFFSEYGEGSSNNKYFEIYNPTSAIVDLYNYAFARVSNSPGNGVGVYEYWVDFDSGAVILPNDVYIVAHPSSDSLILIEADMEYGSLSNGDDGFALVYGLEPPSPASSDSGGYIILDWIGDWNGDPGQGWDVAGENNATANNTLIRKCGVIQGDTSWINAAGTNPVNSQWIVLTNDDWSDIGQHIISPCNLIYGCMDSLACNYDSTVVIDDGSCVYPGQIYQYNISICDGDSVLIGSVYYSQAELFIDSLINTAGCDSIVYTNLSVLFSSNSVYGGIADTTVASGGYYNDLQYLELDCYMPTELVSAYVYAQDTNTITFELRDNNGTVIEDSILQVLPGLQQLYFNFEMPIASDLQLGIASLNSGLYRSNQGVNYPYNFSNLASITSSSAGGQYYYFFYDIEMRLSTAPTHYSICAGDSIYIGDTAYYVTGYYIDSLISTGGCDSIIYTDLLVHNSVNYTNSQTICSGETYLIGGNIYDSTGIYIDSLNTQYGCDSVITTNLTVLTITGSTIPNNQTICFGDSISVGNSTYYNDGVYNDTLQDGNGCDSIIVTTLVTNSAAYGSLYGGIPDTVSGPGAFSSYNGQLNLGNTLPSILKSATVYAQDTNSVTFELRDSSGIELQNITHTVYPGEQVLNFNFLIPVDSNLHLGISAGGSGLYRSSIADGGNWSFPFNIGPVTINSANTGSTDYYYFYYDLEIMPLATYNAYSICEGDSIVVGANAYDTTGNYTDYFVASNSCDSVVYTVLEVYQTPISDTTIYICEGDSIVIAGNIYNTPGVIIETLVASNACDSIHSTYLEYYQTPPLSIESVPNPPDICLGDTITLEASPGFDTYTWSNGITSYIISETPTADITYVVEAVDSNGCTVIEDITVYVDSCILGVEELSFEEGLQIYPNPASEQLTIDFTGKATSIKVYNMLGKLMIEKHITEGKSSVQLFVKDWKAAIYSIQLYRKNGTIAHKVFTVVR